MDQIHNTNACQTDSQSPQHSRASHNEERMVPLQTEDREKKVMLPSNSAYSTEKKKK